MGYLSKGTEVLPDLLTTCAWLIAKTLRWDRRVHSFDNFTLETMTTTAAGKQTTLSNRGPR